MRLTAVRDFKSLRASDVFELELPQFAVLSGPNGSGKSHLLQAIKAGEFRFDGPEIESDEIKLFGLGELSLASEGPVRAAQFKEPWVNLSNNVAAWTQSLPRHVTTEEQIETWVMNHATSYGEIAPEVIHAAVASAGKPLFKFSPRDFADHFPLVIAKGRDVFSASLGELFVGYADRLFVHQMRQWRERDLNSKSEMSDDDFVASYGQPPWTVLDETLAIMGLPYNFVPPPEDLENAQYEVMLRHVDHDVQVRAADLSSGERVIVTIAMALFAGLNSKGGFKRPKVLLLDEADASLHPSMIRTLLTVIETVFIGDFGLQVMLATHSPTTVALAPEPSLFVMSRATGTRLHKSTRDSAVQALTAGVPSLSIDPENRRQIFVESEYDQSVYQALATALKPSLPEVSLEFIPAGRGRGGGCDAVFQLVAELRASGVSTVLGLVDRDRRSTCPEFVEMIDDRYSIENLVYDPLILGHLLIRERLVEPQDVGLELGTKFYEVAADDRQMLIDELTRRLGFDVEPHVEIDYSDGYRGRVATELLDMNGHDLEQRVLDTYPGLRGLGNDIKAGVVRTILSDMPGLIPGSVLRVFLTLGGHSHVEVDDPTVEVDDPTD